MLLPLHQIVKLEEMAQLSGIPCEQVPMNNEKTLQAFRSNKMRKDGLSMFGVYRCEKFLRVSLEDYYIPHDFQGLIWFLFMGYEKWPIMLPYIEKKEISVFDIPISYEKLLIALIRAGIEKWQASGYVWTLEHETKDSGKTPPDFITQLPHWLADYWGEMQYFWPMSKLAESSRRTYLTAYYKVHAPAAFYQVFLDDFEDGLERQRQQWEPIPTNLYKILLSDDRIMNELAQRESPSKMEWCDECCDVVRELIMRDQTQEIRKAILETKAKKPRV